MEAEALLQRRRRTGEDGCRFIPPSLDLGSLYLLEVNAEEHDLAGVEASQLLCDKLVDDPLVLGCGLPPHAANEADGFHPVPPRGHSTPSAAACGLGDYKG